MELVAISSGHCVRSRVHLGQIAIPLNGHVKLNKPEDHSVTPSGNVANEHVFKQLMYFAESIQYIFMVVCHNTILYFCQKTKFVLSIIYLY